MAIDLGSISIPMAALIVSMVAAAATITAAILQLRVAWRKELMARADHKPVTKKAKRGPVTAVFVLLIASAIGGFALSQYLMTDRQKKGDALEVDMLSRIDQLAVSAQRLENIRLLGESDILQQLRSEEALRHGREGVVALLGVAQCNSGNPGNPATEVATTEVRGCTEQQAIQLQLCAEVPALSTVSAIELYVRADDEPGPWNEKKLAAAGNDFGGGRFSEKSNERLVSETTRQVCYGLHYWNSEFGLQARMVVRYVPSPPPEKIQSAVIAPAVKHIE